MPALAMNLPAVHHSGVQSPHWRAAKQRIRICADLHRQKRIASMSAVQGRNQIISQLAELSPAQLQEFLEGNSRTDVSGTGESFFTGPRAQSVRGTGESFFTGPRAQTVR
ncbi:thiovarsolin family RiPP [Streptomyces sp. NPDC006739]|uniref:thiovarsolin family RiPP n=1 Tax=Streptomyces sp. NPDC006739 TaxID=3364763 RepID=UPI0036A6F9AD